MIGTLKNPELILSHDQEMEHLLKNDMDKFNAKAKEWTENYAK